MDSKLTGHLWEAREDLRYARDEAEETNNVEILKVIISTIEIIEDLMDNSIEQEECEYRRIHTQALDK